MEYELIKEIIELTNIDGSCDYKVNAYLSAGWVMLNCAKNVDFDEEIPREFLVYSLAWNKNTEPVRPY